VTLHAAISVIKESRTAGSHPRAAAPGRPAQTHR
jgi:hypothetical protein